MGKLDELMRGNGSENMNASLGLGVVRGPGSAPAATSTAPARWQGVTKSKGAVEIPLGKIERDPNQPREEFDGDALQRLADSIKARGQLQPVRVRWDEGRGVYVVVAGERRWRAARMAGLATLSAVVVEGEIPPHELLAEQLVENCLREDLKPVEKARAFKALIEANGWSQRRLARELALDFTDVSRALSLLDLPGSVQDQVDQGQIPTYTAFEIVKAEPAAREALAGRVVTEKLTRAEVKAVRDRGARPAVRKREWKAAKGIVVQIGVPEGLGDGDVLAALKEVQAQVKREMGKATGPKEAGADAA